MPFQNNWYLALHGKLCPCRPFEGGRRCLEQVESRKSECATRSLMFRSHAGERDDLGELPFSGFDDSQGTRLEYGER